MMLGSQTLRSAARSREENFDDAPIQAARSPIPRDACLKATAILTIVFVYLVPAPSKAEILESQVLVVYNSAAAGATDLKDAYLAAHPGIPAANVLDLNSATLDRADVTHAQFATLIRNPIRNYLLSMAGSAPQQIVSIVLIRPFPHRVLDMNQSTVGDFPSNAGPRFNAGNANYASVDSELVLLWHDLNNGEADGTMDSLADNIIDNPYHTSSVPIESFSRANITTPKTYTNRGNVAWVLGGSGATQLTPGDMYLVTRIDGPTQDDAIAGLHRAQNLRINKALVRIILDEYNTSSGQDLDNHRLFAINCPFFAGNDYEETAALLIADGWDVRYDNTADFIEAHEEPNPIIAYASYGENHSQNGLGQNPPGNGTYMIGFDYPPGAIFNTIESFNARAFNGLDTRFNQGQVATFISAGGTFGVGHVWEPFSFSIPDNEFLFVNFLVNGLSWGEAAYTSLPGLSWQYLVVGDPLARATIVNDPGVPKGDLNGDGSADGLDIAVFIDLVLNGVTGYHATYPALDPIARGDFTGDYRVDLDDQSGFLNTLLAP